MTCPFCELKDEIIVENTSAVAIYDNFPVSEGHCLVIPKRHCQSLFDLSIEEQIEVWKLVSNVRELLAEQFSPDGFNVGLNDGQAAGQTVMHAHLHIIPRYNDDCADARGGVRWIFPDKAAYWK